MIEPDGSTLPENLPPIPSDGLLLHIGVFKTGTTALQETLRRSPELLEAANVLYRGPHSWRWKPLRKILGRDGPMGRKLDESVQSHEGRVFFSAESLCVASDEHARDIVTRLGTGRPARILITVRSLADMLPSTWQQFLKRGVDEPYEEWLRTVLSDTEQDTSIFWKRNNFPNLLRRWGEIVGEENITFVVSDKRQPERILRVTERLLKIEPNTLEFHAAGKSNRSLTFPEAELLRQINENTADLLDDQEYRNLVRLGVFRAMYAQDDPTGGQIPIPAWALEECVEIGARQAEALRASPATIVGDIGEIARSTTKGSGTITPPGQIPIGQAAAAVTGALEAAHRKLNRPPS